MRFEALLPKLELNQGSAGATRRIWKNRAYVVMGYSSRLYIVVGARNLPYALSFEDAIADDWMLI
ncbi:hypothetical protein [Paraburkholderia tagetis]|uniref:Uncharacterized protein n=1 Tax=Paraburkholderia tagetis TaxID=2913261 RepID=A0A9X1RLZ6_9BURK|nr:hypothetical protein [Paraburkholderia tagetis]MCG5072261.1 hypothetical protein [Paraburkholderia tagetis]